MRTLETFLGLAAIIICPLATIPAKTQAEPMQTKQISGPQKAEAEALKARLLTAMELEGMKTPAVVRALDASAKEIKRIPIARTGDPRYDVCAFLEEAERSLQKHVRRLKRPDSEGIISSILEKAIQ